MTETKRVRLRNSRVPRPAVSRVTTSDNCPRTKRVYRRQAEVIRYGSKMRHGSSEKSCMIVTYDKQKNVSPLHLGAFLSSSLVALSLTVEH